MDQSLPGVMRDWAGVGGLGEFNDTQEILVLTEFSTILFIFRKNTLLRIKALVHTIPWCP